MDLTNAQGTSEEFLDIDIAFHSLLLRACGNDMFAELSPSVAAMLRGRTHSGLQPSIPDEEAMERHVELA